MTHSAFVTCILLISISFVAGCKSDEERAAELYDSALSYLERQDVDRALIQLRNVFDNDGFHKEARTLYADLQLERGNFNEAYGQYLRLVEQYPDMVDARETLALMALERRDWDEALRHGEAAIALDPDRAGTRAIKAALNYRAAIQARDEAGQDAAVQEARAVLDDDPSVLAAHRLVIDSLFQKDEAEAALEQIDAALPHARDAYEIHMLRTQALARLEQTDKLGQQLQEMYALFPTSEEVRTALIRWYVTQQDFEGLIAFLRREAGPAAEDIEGNLAVVEALRVNGDTTAAEAELDKLIAEAGESAVVDLYRTLRATLRFEAGERDAAMAEIQSVLEGAPPSDQTRRIRIMLARMLGATDNPVGAREQVEMVLAEDPTDVEALKIRAGWAIEEDRPGPAINDLRTALDQAPRDTALLQLMAEAYLRDGSPELAQERLSVAVQISDGGASESLTYARFLLSRNRPQQAETVLVRARRNAPENIQILGLLGEVYLRAQNWPQTQEIIDHLRRLEAPEADQLARVFQSSVLFGQNRIEEGLEYLRAQIETEAGGDVAAVIQLARSMLLAGRIDEARVYVDEQLAEKPDSLPLTLLSANIHALQGDLQEAETIYRGLLSRQPDIEPAILQLQALLRATERVDEAEMVVREGLQALPESRRLRLQEAYRLEKEGQFEEAIALYEALYEEDSRDMIVANNLASMLSNHREGAEEIERAYAIARRLTGTEVPAFRDTLGWVLFLRGDTERAIAELEPAAEALPEEPSVLVHLGLAYAEAGRTEEARTMLERGVSLAGETTETWRIRAKEVLAEL